SDRVAPANQCHPVGEAHTPGQRRPGSATQPTRLRHGCRARLCRRLSALGKLDRGYSSDDCSRGSPRLEDADKRISANWARPSTDGADFSGLIAINGSVVRGPRSNRILTPGTKSGKADTSLSSFTEVD